MKLLLWSQQLKYTQKHNPILLDIFTLFSGIVYANNFFLIPAVQIYYFSVNVISHVCFRSKRDKVYPEMSFPDVTRQTFIQILQIM